MKKEIRKLLATIAIRFSLWVLPDCEFTQLYAKFLEENILKL